VDMQGGRSIVTKCCMKNVGSNTYKARPVNEKKGIRSESF